jgi:thiosulfate reductase cytochrome b subunit
VQLSSFLFYRDDLLALHFVAAPMLISFYFRLLLLAKDGGKIIDNMSEIAAVKRKVFNSG